jgi:hypothetical protein
LVTRKSDRLWFIRGEVSMGETAKEPANFFSHVRETQKTADEQQEARN